MAQEKLDAVLPREATAPSATHYAKYLDLTQDQRRELLGRVTVLDGAVDAASLTDRLIASVRKATVAQRRVLLVERLRGWWHGRALTHLALIAEGKSDWIELSEAVSEGRSTRG